MISTLLSAILITAQAAAGAQTSAGAPETQVREPAAAQRLVQTGQDLYRQGKLGEALIAFEDAVKAGAVGGELFYQIGFCYKAVREDPDKSRQFMAKAVPLLEEVTADPAVASIAPFYYLAAAYANELADPVKGKSAAQRGVALVEKGSFSTVKDGDTLFQIGRLYSLAGDPDKALPWYEKAAAALDTGKVTNKQYLVTCHEQIAALALRKEDYEKSVLSLKRLMALDPSREQDRLSAGMVMIKADRFNEAIQVLTGFTNDELGSEANYIVRVLRRHVGFGSPAIPAATKKMNDEALLEELRKAGSTLAGIREKDDEKVRAEPPPELPWKWVETRKGTKRKVSIGRIYPPPDWQPKDPNNPTPEEVDYMAGVISAPKTIPVPPSAERLAAEKVFFGLLTEKLRRGHLLREMAVVNGFAALIFK